MVFSSIVFLFYYLPVVLLVYYLSPSIRLKNSILLIASLAFYAWGEGELVLLMVLSSVFNFGIGWWVHKTKNSIFPIFVGVTVNLLTLIYFKYIGLLVGSIDSILGTTFNNGIDIHLPIGISFFTFQSISYIVDVKRGAAKVQKNPLDLMLYISLFPQLIAGPIVRYTQVERELTWRTHSLENFVSGAKRFCLGLAKKVLIANVVGEVSNELFALPADGVYAAIGWFAIVAFALQVYFDFSGYSDMAIGLGKMFGFKFPENFNYPYISRSIQEFWQRWHITLSSWFKDYVYIPLGGSRRGLGRTYFNLLFVFFITGLWHGGAWNFVVWGVYHGVFVVIERAGLKKILVKSKVLGLVYAQGVVVLSFVVFNMPDMRSTAAYYGAMLFRYGPLENGKYLYEFLNVEYITIFILGIILCAPIKPEILKWKEKISHKMVLVIWPYVTSAFYLTLLVLSVMSISSSTYNPFIYFRF